MPVLRADAHLTVIDAVNKGYMKWREMPPEGHESDYVSRVHYLRRAVVPITKPSKGTAANPPRRGS